jgi:predicted ATPase/signal transduction histidine kinase
MGAMGSGRTGEIYRGARYVVTRRTRAGVPVVVKTVRPECADAAGAYARLTREHDLLAGLQLPGIVHLVALEQADPDVQADRQRSVALVLEDAGRRTLKQLLRRRPLAPEQFLTIATRLTEVVARLHERNVIHRDINPSNVVIGDQGTVTLIDFDAATTTGGPPGGGGVPAHRGAALPYTSPEETGRVCRLVDRRADLYSLGATFYEMLTGAPPFVSSDPVELVHAHLARSPLPPYHVNPAVPQLLSDLVLKLLVKMPEGRYQLADALLADLREAQARLKESGAIGQFELGTSDLASDLPLPEALYQREQEQAVLVGALDRAAAGERVVVLLSGPAGVGKSALATDLRAPVARRGGRFLLGKCEVRRSSTPYAPIVQALEQLLPPAGAAAQRDAAPLARRLREALGTNAGVITELCPELERLLGPAAPVPALGPAESQNRLHAAFRRLMQALAAGAAPLVLAVEDVHWGDAGTLALLRVLAEAPELARLMLIVTWRPEDLAPDHPARACLDGLAAAGPGAAIQIALSSLEQETITALCAATLHCPAERARPLAELVLRKTGGNPLFVRRLLRFLHRSELLRFDRGQGAWTWDLARIERVGVSDNVVDVLLATLCRLAPDVREALATAACLGNRASLGTVAAVNHRPVDATADALWTAVKEGLLVALDGDAPAGAEANRFAFVHDRIQQAAYSLLGEPARQATHLRAGRQLLREGRSRGAEDGAFLFAVVDQFGLAGPSLEHTAERVAVAELNLAVGRKARASAVPTAALDYLRRGIALLPAAPAPHPLAFPLHRDALECAALTAERALMEQLFPAALALASTRREKAEVYLVRAEAATLETDFGQALAWLEAGLALFDIELPRGAAAPAIRAELAGIEAALAGRRLEDLVALPDLQDPDLCAAMELLAAASPPLYFTGDELWPFVNARLVNLSLRHGVTACSPFAFVTYAVQLQKGGDYQLGHRFGRLAVELARRLGDPVMECRTLTVFVTTVSCWLEPLESRLAQLREVQARGMEAGELNYGFSCTVTSVLIRFHRGVELARLLPEIEAGIAAGRSSNRQSELALLLACEDSVHRLQGLPRREGRSEGADPSGQRLYLQLHTAYLLGAFAEARALSEAAAPHLASATRSVMLVEFHFATALTLAACWQEEDAAGRAALRARIAASAAQLATWAANCPDNYRHKHLLVEAEAARVDGRVLEAAELYEQAVEAASQQGFLHDEALANELAGRFHRAQGRQRSARPYLAQAADVYLRWGARAKAEALEEEFPDLRLDAGQPAASRRPAAAGNSDSAFDLETLFRAAEAITREVVPSRLLSKLMEVCLVTAGAERGALVLDEADGPRVRAIGSLTEGTSLPQDATAAAAQVPAALIERVRHAGEPVVLADASAHPELGRDPYVAARGVRSALATPILRQRKLAGVLYLENNLATHVFSPERVRVLQLLCSHIATALENSSLFDELTREVEERRRAETAVRFLAESGAALSESLDYEATLAKVARIAVSFIADWCTVDLMEGGRMQRVAQAHRDPVKEAPLRELRRQQQQQQATPVRALRNLARPRPTLYAEISEATLAEFVPDPERRRVVRELGVASGMVVPLTAGERHLGAITLVSSDAGRRYGPRDLALAEELARRAALAIDNARLYREAREAIRLRDEFLSIASHELNTPIASLKLLTQGIEQGSIEPSGPRMKNTMRIISRQTKRLADLVSDLLDVARIHQRSLELHRAPVDLAALVAEVAGRFRADLERAGCTLTVAGQPALVGAWDRARLDQVVTNLLGNALKFGAGAGIEITVRTTDGRARLRVRDHGIGIPSDRLPYIFGRFERAVSAAHYGGLGLGLYIVNEIVIAHGGTVTVESEPGAGAAFTVELPFA